MDFGRALLSKRLYAFNIDLVMILLMEKSLINLYYLTTKQVNIFEFIHSNTLLLKPLDTVLLTVTILSYFTLSYYLFNGKTIGKSLFNLRVFSKGHLEISLYNAFSRSLGYFTCMIPMNLLFVVPFLTKSARGLPDWLSETEVVTDNFYDHFQQEVSPSSLDLHYAYSNPIPLPDHHSPADNQEDGVWDTDIAA
jgi:uncharacterized RDD family membrane protein YckC